MEADHFHPFEWVADFVLSLVAEGDKELVGAELDVVAHHGRIHLNEFEGEGINNEFHFDVVRAADNVGDVCCRKAVDQFGVKEACKVAVESFVAADNSLLKLRPGTSLRFLSQNMEQKEPEKKMPLTVTNAIIRLAKLALVELHHLRAQLALRWMHGTVL